MTPQEEYVLGLAFYNGEGQEKNIGEAIKHFEIAANAGNLEAMNKLGVAYANEEEYRDIELAIRWFAKASTLGFSRSTLNLGKLFSYEKYGQVDGEKAIAFFKQALSQGNKEAASMLGDAYYYGELVPGNVCSRSLFLRRNGR